MSDPVRKTAARMHSVLAGLIALAVIGAPMAAPSGDVFLQWSPPLRCENGALFQNHSFELYAERDGKRELLSQQEVSRYDPYPVEVRLNAVLGPDQPEAEFLVRHFGRCMEGDDNLYVKGSLNHVTRFYSFGVAKYWMLPTPTLRGVR